MTIDKTNTDQMRVFFRGGPKNGEMQIFHQITDTLVFDQLDELAIEPMESRHQSMQDISLLLSGETAGMQFVRHEYQFTHDTKAGFLIFTYKGSTTK